MTTDQTGTTVTDTWSTEGNTISTATNASEVGLGAVQVDLTSEKTSITEGGSSPTTFAESTPHSTSTTVKYGSRETTSTSYSSDSYATAYSNETTFYRNETTFYRTSAGHSQAIDATTGLTSSGSAGATDSVAGVVILSILIVLLVAAILFYFLWRRKRRSSKSKPLQRVENGTELKEDNNKVRGNSFASLNEHSDSTVDSKTAPPNSNSNSKSQPIRKASKHSGQSNAPHSDQSASSTPPPKPKRDESPSPSSNRREFLENIRRLQDDLTIYQKEFERLPNGSNKLCSVAKTQINISKNRYVNVLPFDETRVILSKKSEEDSDYINASYIDGAKKKRAYIASQGPTNATIADFWTMIWDNECNRILMLTNLEESVRGLAMVKTSKCARYWPSDVGEEVKYGDQSVRLLNESVATDWVVRTLALRKEDCELVRIVQQYHYTTWPDQDVPHTSTAVLQFHRLSLKCPDALSASGPILFHCSAGVGRTGTLIAIDILEELWEDTRPFCDVYKIVKGLRHQRMSMVQSVRQYLFIHHSLVQSFFVGDAVELKPQQLEHYQLTSKHEEQFKVLALVSITNIAQYTVAKSKPDKNRSQTVLPVNSFIRFLKPVREDDGIYINAIAVNGYKDRNSLIVTQMPLKDTINDFWRLANDNSCGVVVMLNSAFSPDERYWPEDVGDVMKTKSFKIKISGTGKNHVTNGLLVTDLEICYHGNLKKSDDSSSEDDDYGTDENGSRRSSRNDRISGVHDLEGGPRWRPVMHLRVTDWPEAEPFPRDPILLLNIYEQIVQLRTARGSKRPVVVHCMYGTARSGLLCTLVNVLDRLNDQGIVGIFDAVKLLKERRQELIPDVDHYDYLHKLVSTYLARKREQGQVIGAMTSGDKKQEMTSDINQSAIGVSKTVAKERGVNGTEGHKDTLQGQEPASTREGQPASRPNDQNQRTANKNDADAQSNAGNQRQPDIETRTEKRTSARLDGGNHHEMAELVERL